MTQQNRSAAWDRLRNVLTAIKPGETITAEALVEQTGLSSQTVHTVLDGLARAELFERIEPKVFVRRSLLKPAVAVPAAAAR